MGKLNIKAPRLFVREAFLVDAKDVKEFKEHKESLGFEMVECAEYIEDRSKRVVSFEKWNQAC